MINTSFALKLMIKILIIVGIGGVINYPKIIYQIV